MTISTSATGDRVYTNGRLVLSEEEGYDVDEALGDLRLRWNKARAEVLDEGLPEAVAFYDDKLRRVKRIRKRLASLFEEKSWGVLDDAE